MVTSAERRRLESAYPVSADPKPVLRACAIGLLAVMVIAVAAAFMGGGSDSELVAGVSARQGASGR